MYGKKWVSLLKNIIMFNLEESEKQKQFADFSAYLQLKRLNYTDEDVVDHLSCSTEYLKMIIEKFN